MTKYQTKPVSKMNGDTLSQGEIPTAGNENDLVAKKHI
jgi:hypothetical protein